MRYSLLGAPSLEVILRLRSPESTIHSFRKMSSTHGPSRLRKERMALAFCECDDSLTQAMLYPKSQMLRNIQQRPWFEPNSHHSHIPKQQLPCSSRVSSLGTNL
jgi:hypothetical protein